jgi:hypothetical protein
MISATRIRDPRVLTMDKHSPQHATGSDWPPRPPTFPDLMTPVEAALFLRLDETGHGPKSATRTLNYWRGQGELRATRFARRVWYLRQELEAFLKKKTEE